MKGKTAEDLYAKMEREIRTPAERLLLDAFLPKPEAIASALHRPEPPAVDPAAAPGAAGMFGESGPAVSRDREAEEPAARRRVRPRKSAEPQRSLEEEIQDFLNLRGSALAPDTDPDREK
jgi:hypothetical protein